MNQRVSIFLVALWVGIPSAAFSADDAQSDAAVMKAVAMEAGRISPSEKIMYEQSIQSTKKSIARETLDVFYHDALDYYRRASYDEALELLDKIYSIDPYYEDVSTLRETIRRMKTSHDIESKRGILQEYMRKGNAAQQAGQTVAAIGFWKQALVVNSSYEPAKKKIRQVNHGLAQKQYEAGYLYYHHGDMEQALDSWSNAIALDPSFKQRGLLQLMSKIELSLRRDRMVKLTAQAAQQYAQKDLAGALATNQELLTLDPRNEEARRMAAKIKIQLGQASYKSARDAVSQKLYAEGIKKYQEAIKYGYEVQRSQRGIQEAERMVQSDRDEKTASKSKKADSDEDKAAAQKAALAAAAPPAQPPVTINAEEANLHYRQSLAAIRSKDYHRAVEECEIASKLNPNDEHIYVSCQRAKQEWAAINAGRGAQ